MKKFMRLPLLVPILGATIILSACNTIEGAGKDLQSAGEAVEDVAK